MRAIRSKRRARVVAQVAARAGRRARRSSPAERRRGRDRRPPARRASVPWRGRRRCRRQARRACRRVRGRRTPRAAAPRAPANGVSRSTTAPVPGLTRVRSSRAASRTAVPAPSGSPSVNAPSAKRTPLTSPLPPRWRRRGPSGGGAGAAVRIPNGCTSTTCPADRTSRRPAARRPRAATHLYLGLPARGGGRGEAGGRAVRASPSSGSTARSSATPVAERLTITIRCTPRAGARVAAARVARERGEGGAGRRGPQDARAGAAPGGAGSPWVGGQR